MHSLALLTAALLVLPCASTAQAPPKASGTVSVRSIAELRVAVKAAQPGTRIEIAPGDYAGGLYFGELRGEAGRPIVLAGADPANPPRFTGGRNGLHLVNPFHVQLHDLHFTGATANGVSIDNGARYVATPRGIVLRRLRITDVGPRGNHDAIKLSGLTGFRVEDCTLERWGTGGGSGVDMVGCHQGLLRGNTLRHSADPQATGGSGIQAKGGCRDIVIRGNRFEHAGERAVNLGGSTGLPYFRPPLDQWPGTERYEAAELLVEGNTFLGSRAPICFVGVDGATVRFNTIVDPDRWALRILQETKEPGFIPARRGKFTDNIIVFRSDAWVTGGANIGDGTAPETFEFARNVWFCRDRPDRSKPTLPTPERDGLHGTDPQLREDLHLAPTSPVRDRGADAAAAGEQRS
jgi:hypothetical protein